jgi:predicted nuclease of predicted toxin-antitoxin system
MRLKLDENLPGELADMLRQKGHEADTVLDERLGGRADPVIAKACRDERRILITLDSVFSDLRNYPPQHHGIIVLRLARQDRNTVLAIIPRLLELLRTEQIAQRLWIVDDRRTRIRGAL